MYKMTAKYAIREIQKAGDILFLEWDRKYKITKQSNNKINDIQT